MAKSDKESELSGVIGGTLSILGLKIDLAKLLSSSEEVRGRLEELREKLKKAGGREALNDEEWRRGEVSISGHLRTHGVLGEREYHIGTAGPATQRRGEEMISEPPEAVEPPVDVFHEAGEVVVVAEVPGVGLADLELKVAGDVLSLATKRAARRSYKKEIKLGFPVDVESLKATCRNGILEVHLQKRTSWREPGTMVVEIDEKNLKYGVLGLVIALVEIIRDALKLQALKRMEGGSLTEEELERLGEALLDLDRAIQEIKEEQGLIEAVRSVRDGLDEIVDDVLHKMVDPEKRMEKVGQRA